MYVYVFIYNRKIYIYTVIYIYIYTHSFHIFKLMAEMSSVLGTGFRFTPYSEVSRDDLNPDGWCLKSSGG